MGGECVTMGHYRPKYIIFPPVLATKGAKMDAIDVVTSVMTSLR